MAAAVLVVSVVGCSTEPPQDSFRESLSASRGQTPDAMPTAIESEADRASCDGEGYSVRHPASWFVHPPEPARNVPPCSLFATEPFETELEPDGGWTGAQIVLRTAEGCQGSFESVLSERELEIQGYPAWARELAAGEGPNAGELSAYQYTVNLAPGRPCEVGAWFFGRTEVDAPGDPADNRGILDEMMMSVEFEKSE